MAWLRAAVWRLRGTSCSRPTNPWTVVVPKRTNLSGETVVPLVFREAAWKPSSRVAVPSRRSACDISRPGRGSVASQACVARASHRRELVAGRHTGRLLMMPLTAHDVTSWSLSSSDGLACSPCRPSHPPCGRMVPSLRRLCAVCVFRRKFGVSKQSAGFGCRRTSSSLRSACGTRRQRISGKVPLTEADSDHPSRPPLDLLFEVDSSTKQGSNKVASVISG
jgi:hypothetical protein